MKVLVIGASGVIGRAVTAEMLERGHTVTAATRSGAPVEGLVVQAVTGDASDPASVTRLAAGQDAVASAHPGLRDRGRRRAGTRQGLPPPDHGRLLSKRFPLDLRRKGAVKGGGDAGREGTR